MPGCPRQSHRGVTLAEVVTDAVLDAAFAWLQKINLSPFLAFLSFLFRTMARPMPRALPVTMAVLPDRSILVPLLPPGTVTRSSVSPVWSL